MSKSRSLTILLLKGDSAGVPGQFIRSDRPEWGPTPPHDLDLGPETRASLFVKKTRPDPPRWADFFAGFVSPGALGTVSSSSAVLIVFRGGNWFAVTFGQGRYMIQPDSIVDGFGLRVTLNAVRKESVRSIDKKTFDAIATRQQATQVTDAGEFGLDIERDLLRAVTGTPEKWRNLGQRLYGMDALAITIQVALEELPELLERVYKAYQEVTYLADWGWVDNIKAVMSQELISFLDEQLLSTVAENDFSNTWLAAPQILEWADVRFFAYSHSEHARVFTDIHWRTLLRAIRSPLSIGLLKHKRVICYGEDNRVLGEWPAYRCIYAEVDYRQGSYLLTNGQWYKIKTNYVEDVNEWFANFPKAKGVLPIYDHESEEDYNISTASSSSGRLALLDRKLVPYGGGQSSIELCDLLDIGGDLIHVKRYSGSRDLSHLFAQGLVSGKLLRVDQDFRDALSQVVPKAHCKACRLSDGNASGRRITFAVIYRSRGPIALPFFSKISLRQASRDLIGFGYSVRLVGIDMDEARARLEKMRSQATDSYAHHRTPKRTGEGHPVRTGFAAGVQLI